MKYKAIIIIALCLTAAVTIGSQEITGDSYNIIVKVPKDPATLNRLSGVPEMILFQDLNTCFLGMVPVGTFNRLRDRGIHIQLLLDVRDHELFLVTLPPSGDLDLLNQFGESAFAEPGIAVFSPETVSHPRDILPPQYRLKKLSPRLRIRDPERHLSFTPSRGITIDTSRDDSAALKEIADQVSTETLTRTIQDLQDFNTRYSTTPENRLAGDYLYQTFSSLGLPVEFQDFSLGGVSSRNVIAVHRGKANPDVSVIICAHYDSTSNDFTYYAPGADDNATGVSAVIEGARILSQYSFDFSIKFVCFSGEEQGLYGSNHFAAVAARNREKIIGVLNLDMIGYVNPHPEDLDVVFNATSYWIGEKYQVYAARYTHLPILPLYSPSTTASDHSPFWDAGYDAILGIEDTPLRNPYYHQETDTLDKLDMDFCTSVVKTTLLVAAGTAQLHRSPDPPSGVASRSQLSYSLFSSYKNNLVTWQPGDQTITGYNIYRTTSSHTMYTRLNDTPLTGTSWFETYLPPQNTYYYTVTAIDQDGRESNYSLEVRENENNNQQ